MIHLDTGFLIGALRRGSAEDRRLRDWPVHAEPIGISAVSWAEFLCGPVEGTDVDRALRIVDEPVPLLAEDATRAAGLFNHGGRGSLNDCMIAAIALRLDAAVATTNRENFRRFEAAGLRLAAG